MKLLVVESPAKAKTISKYLSDIGSKDKFEVVASVGHVRDLPKSNKKAIDIDGGFVPHYEVVAGKEKVINEIKRLSKKASEVFLATDPDREGEAIAWHIAEAIDLKNPQRVVFHEITKDAVVSALEHPRKIDTNLREAQEARRVLDRLVGYDLSGLIWKKVRYGLSAGRVQSPALRIIMEREREIRAFKSHKFWIITADTKTPKNEAMTLTCAVEPTEYAEVERIVEAGKSGNWKITDVKETAVKRSPRAPFITSTLQQTASSRLGFAPAKTMAIAQKLYEAGHITYMRTDSTNLAASAKSQIAAVIQKKFGEKYLSIRNFAAKSKNAQEAHEAIRPTNFSHEASGATDEQKRLYKLIWQRTVASQMTDAEMLRTKITANIFGEVKSVAKNETKNDTEKELPAFSITGSRIIFAGWIEADDAINKEDTIVPKVEIDEKLFLLEMKTEEKETEPPTRYSEAGLIKELEKRGIGRPSTYASTIKTIQDRGYVEKLNKALIPTDTGDVVSTFLEENFTNYISDTFTAEMEDKLDDIATGKGKYLKTLEDFYKPFKKEVKSKEKIEKITNLGKADPQFKCPVCGKDMIIKLGKSGKFMSCESFPDCVGARTIEGEELAGPKETGEACPECSTGKLIERDGKYGRFIACNNYPKCKYVKKDPELEKKSSTGVACPVCKNGFMVEKRGRFGIFYSCNNYPDCKQAIKARPTGKICDYMREKGPCGALIMEGTKTIPERCSDKTCPNHNPHKLDKVVV